MAQVEVKLFATLRKYVSGATSIDVEIEPGQTVESVLEGLGVPAGQVRIIFIDNRPAGLSDALDGGQQVGIFPAIGGG